LIEYYHAKSYIQENNSKTHLREAGCGNVKGLSIISNDGNLL